MQPTLQFKRLNADAKIPNRAHTGDCGFDLFTLDPVCIQAGEVVSIPTGIAAGFPPGWGGIIKARSSQGKMGINVLGGVVDQGYTGQIIVMLHNTADSHSDNNVFYEAGDKIAQLVLIPVFPGAVEEVKELGETERGEKGFGSSGR